MYSFVGVAGGALGPLWRIPGLRRSIELNRQLLAADERYRAVR
jgi:hypothetical protein